MPPRTVEQLRLASFTVDELDRLFAMPEFDEACAAFDGSEEQFARLAKLGAKLLFENKHSV